MFAFGLDWVKRLSLAAEMVGRGGRRFRGVVALGVSCWDCGTFLGFAI